MKRAPISSALLAAVAMLALTGCDPNANPFKDMKLPDWMQAKQATPSGSSLVSANPGCPRVAALPELARVTQFADEANQAPSTILSETVLTKLDSSCILTETHINLDIVLNFTSRLGTAGLAQASPQASYSHAYFVAVVKPDGSIIAKDVFGLSPIFTSGQKEVYSSERLQQSIPLSSNIPAGQYQVMVGFQLNESELAYNRSLKSLKQPVIETQEVKPVVAPAPARGLSIQPLVRNRKPANQ